VTKELFGRCKTPEDFVGLPLDELLKIIKPTGLL